MTIKRSSLLYRYYRFTLRLDDEKPPDELGFCSFWGYILLTIMPPVPLVFLCLLWIRHFERVTPFVLIGILATMVAVSPKITGLVLLAAAIIAGIAILVLRFMSSQRGQCFIGRCHAMKESLCPKVRLLD